MSQFDKATRGDEGAAPGRAKRPAGEGAPPRRNVLDGRAHPARPGNETEGEVTVVVEEKGGKG